MQDRVHRLSMPEPNSGCWLWTAAVTGRGYGMVSVSSNGKRNNFRAHRYSYMAFKGPIPEGMNVCHSCDVPSCVNPDHLWIGTQGDNLLDCYAKGRRDHCRTPAKKMTADEVLEARKLHNSGPMSIKQLAARFGVAYATMNQALRGVTWAHL